MKFTFIVLVVLLPVLLPFSSAFSSENVTLYSGDLLSRSTLTGDWGGIRNDLANKGLRFDASVTQTEQGVTKGGKNQKWEYGGRGILNFHMDTQKLGLWPGGFLDVEAEGNWENAVNQKTGGLMPVNSSQVYPLVHETLCVPAAAFTQFLSGYFGITIGKHDTTSGDMNEFAHGKGDDQFFNMAFNINPVALVAVPYSTLGAGAVILPVKENPESAIITLMAFSADGKPNTSGLGDLANGNNVYAASARVRTDFFGCTGHQAIGGGYSSKSFTSLDQNLRFIIEAREIEQKDNSWMAYYNFDQYLLEPQKGSGKGMGIFGRLGVSDGNPNPMEYFYSIGFGGKGFLSCRSNDGFGIGYYYLDIKQPRFTGLITTRAFLRDEQGVEAYYNIGITPWMQLTPDIQVIKGAQENESSDEIPLKQKIHRAAALGCRLKMIF